MFVVKCKKNLQTLTSIPRHAGRRIEMNVSDHCLEMCAPSLRWDEGLPLGNGLMGALVWGNGAPLNISLDRSDLWDLRPVPEFQTDEYNYNTIRAWVEAGREDDLERLYRGTYMRNPAPTKLPAGRIVLPLSGKPVFEKAKLLLAEQLSLQWRSERQGVFKIYVSAF